MNFRSLLAIGALSVCSFHAAHAQDAEHSKAERYIVDSERQWAVADAAGNAAFVDNLLADDFVGVAPDGHFYKKAEALEETRQNKGKFVSNQVNRVQVRFYGDTAVAQGTETWEMVHGVPKRGSYVWTDTWVSRNGKWQIVAAQDVAVAAIEK